MSSDDCIGYLFLILLRMWFQLLDLGFVHWTHSVKCGFTLSKIKSIILTLPATVDRVHPVLFKTQKWAPFQETWTLWIKLMIWFSSGIDRSLVFAAGFCHPPYLIPTLRLKKKTQKWLLCSSCKSLARGVWRKGCWLFSGIFSTFRCWETATIILRMPELPAQSKDRS